MVDRTSQEVISLLALLSASSKNGQALPPYLKMPGSFHISDQLRTSNLVSMDPKEITGPGYPAFAAIEVASYCLIDSVQNIVGLVRELVGELDFRFEVVGTSAKASSDGLGESGEEKTKLH